MRTDGIFRLIAKSINVKVGEDLHVIPFGDVHYDAPGFDQEKWDEFLERGRSLKNVLFLGMGDYTDSYSTSERDTVYAGHLHESTLDRLEREGKRTISQLAKDLSFMRGKIIGLMSGNHFMQFPGITGDQLLANKLGADFLGVCCYVKLSMRVKHTCHLSYTIFAHHGKGGGLTAGGRFNSVERMQQNANADLYLMGDNHARGALPVGDRLDLVSNPQGLYLRTRKCWLGRTGSFLRAYQPDKASYVVDRCLPPSSLGWIEFVLTPTRKRDGCDRISLDVKAIQ